MAHHKFKCDRCCEIHDDYDDANDCCRPLVLDVWVCESCAEYHYADQDATECCAADDKPETAEMYQKRIAELESAGQQCLPYVRDK